MCTEPSSPVICNIIPKILKHRPLQRRGQKLIPPVELLHAVGADAGGGLGDVTGGGDLVGGVEVQPPEHHGGAEETGGENVCLGLGLGLHDETLGAGIALFKGVAEEDVAELVGDGEADGLRGIVIVEDDVPFALDVLGVAPFGRAEQVHGGVGDQFDSRIPCDLLERDGQRRDAVIQEALPRAVSGGLVDTIIHLYHPRGWFATLGTLLCVRCRCQIQGHFPACRSPRGCGR